MVLGGRPHRMALAAALASSACTYGPAQDSATITQVVRLPVGGEALVTVQRMVARSPTGLSAFPDGGRLRVLEREGIIYRVDGQAGVSTRVAAHRPADTQWESYTLWVAGFSADGSVFVRASGCPRGGECHPELTHATLYLLTPDGQLEPVEMLPEDVSLLGESLAPAPNETDYVRYSRDSETISVRTRPDGDFRPAFRISPSGALSPEGG